MKLTKSEIDPLTCPPGRRDVLFFDAELSGFALRVTDKGAKTFLLQYRFGGAQRRLRIGRYGGPGGLTPAQARKIAQDMRLAVAAGRDPVAERRSTAAAERAAADADALTVRRVLELWEARRLGERSLRYRTEAPRALRLGLADVLDTPAHTVTPELAQQLLDGGRRVRAWQKNAAGKMPSALPAAGSGVIVLRVRDYARAMFGWAIKARLLPHGHTNPFAAVQLETRPARRERYLADPEIAEVWQAAGGLGRPWGPYVRFLLLTLQREAETAGLRWSEIAADGLTWELPGARAKNGKAHLVHLSAPARAILRDIPRLAGSDLVFTTTGRTPIAGFSKAKARLDAAIAKARAKRAEETGEDAAPMPPWRFHDFRRTGVTVMARTGISWEVADRVLNHRSGAISGVAAIYQRHEFLAERAAALDAWAEHVLSLAGDNVVPFPADRNRATRPEGK